MEVLNEMAPTTAEQVKAATVPEPPEPVVVVNLLNFKHRAEYADGSDSDLSGRDAYHRYLRGSVPLIEQHSGRILIAGDVTYLRMGAC